MSLKDIARPLIERGIRVVPAKPGERASTLPGWPTLATTDPTIIEEWDKQYPDWNLVCVANFDDVCIVDIDNLKAAYKMGMPEVPDTFTVKSPTGHHAYFKHTAASRAMRSRVVKNGMGTVAEFKDHNKSCCAPGCTRADGGVYKVEDASLLIDIPQRYLEWFQVQDAREKPKELKPVHDDFDFDELMDFYGIEVLGSGPWYYPSFCPIKDDIHTNDGKPDLHACSFYFDGDYLGWKSLAQSCEGASMSIGAVIKFLNQQKGEPYLGPIWTDREEYEEVDESQFAPDLDDPVPAPKPREKCYTPGCKCGLEHVYPQSNVSAVGRAAMEEALALEADGGTVAVEAVAAHALSADDFMKAFTPAATRQRFVESGLTDIPDGALYGWLGDVARKLDLPLSIAYPAVLTAYSAVLHEDEILGVQCNLYTALMMGVGGGKNIALTRSAGALNLRYELDYMDATIGGAGGLFMALGDKSEGKGKNKVEIPGPRRMLINPAEFAATLANMKLENSTLATHLCNLWDKRQISLPVREGKREINCRLTILGALPVDAEAPETFTRYFGEETGAGLYSRFLFGFTKEKIDHRWAERWKWEPPVAADYTDDLVPIAPPTGWSNDAEDFYSDMELYGDVDGRGMFNLKRIALLLSTANRDKLVTLDAVRSAELFMLWQSQLKRHFKHGEARQLRSGDLSTIILDTLRCIGENGDEHSPAVIDGGLVHSGAACHTQEQVGEVRC